MWTIFRHSKSFLGGRHARTERKLMVLASSRWSRIALKPETIRVLQGGSYNLCYNRHRLSTRPILSASEDLQTALAGTQTVREVLDVWHTYRNSAFSHNVVRSCLFYSLKAAQSEGLSSTELFAVADFDQFWSQLMKEIHSMSANCAVKCLYNCAQFNFHHTELSSLLIEVCSRKCKTIPSVSIGILLWSLKRLNLLSSSSTQPLLGHVIELFHSRLCMGERFKTQSLTNIIWVLSTSGNLSKELGETVVRCLPQYVTKFDFHSLSLVLWSLTNGGAVLSQPLLNRAGRAAAKFVKNDKTVANLVHTCLAFGTAEYYHQSFCKSLGQVIIDEPENSSLLTSRFLSCVAWMCSRVSYFNPSLLDSIACRTLAKLAQFNSQDLGNLMYSYAQLNYPHRELVREVTKRFLEEERLWKDDDAWVSIAWANLAIEEYPVQLLEHLVDPSRVTRLIEAGDQNSLNFLLRLDVLLKSELHHLGLSLPHRHSVLAQALLLSQWYHPQSKLQDRITKVLSEITQRNKETAPLFTLEALTTTLYSIDIELILDDRGQPISIPHQWRSWENTESLINSPILSEYTTKLPELVKNSEDTYSENDSNSLCLASDWAELVGGPDKNVAKRVAIEVDGPWHYAANCPHTLGKTLLKHRVLRSQGWTVVSIPYYKWQELGNKEARTNFLRTIIFTFEK